MKRGQTLSKVECRPTNDELGAQIILLLGELLIDRVFKMSVSLSASVVYYCQWSFNHTSVLCAVISERESTV